MANIAPALPVPAPPPQPDMQLGATTDLQASQRARALAEQLRQMSLEDSTAPGGGRVSWTQGLGRLAQALVASRMEHKANVGEWDAHARQQALSRSIHYGDAAPLDLSANPYRSNHERAKLAQGLRNLNPQPTVAPDAPTPGVTNAPAMASADQKPANGALIAPAAAPVGNVPSTVTGPQIARVLQANMPPVNPAGNAQVSGPQIARVMQGKPLLPAPTGGTPPAPSTADGGPVQVSESNIQHPVRMDRLLSTMPADAAMYFEQSDPGAYWKAVSKSQEPADDERYAAHFGQTGSKEFNSALQDYRLRSYGPSAVDAKGNLMSDRYGYMGDLQDDRLRSTERNTDVRTNASINNNIRSTSTTARGQDFTHQDRERGQDFTHQDRTRGQDFTHADRTRQQDMIDSRVRGSASYQGTGGRHGGGAPAMAVGSNGHRIVVQNGRWVDAQTGQPVQ